MQVVVRRLNYPLLVRPLHLVPNLLAHFCSNCIAHFCSNFSPYVFPNTCSHFKTNQSPNWATFWQANESSISYCTPSGHPSSRPTSVPHVNHPLGLLADHLVNHPVNWQDNHLTIPLRFLQGSPQITPLVNHLQDPLANHLVNHQDILQVNLLLVPMVSLLLNHLAIHQVYQVVNPQAFHRGDLQCSQLPFQHHNHRVDCRCSHPVSLLHILLVNLVCNQQVNHFVHQVGSHQCKTPDNLLVIHRSTILPTKHTTNRSAINSTNCSTNYPANLSTNYAT